MSRAACVLALVLGLAPCLVADAKDYFVNNEVGDDRKPGTSEVITGDDGPFRSIGRALRSAGRGDRVVVAKTNTPYHESLSVQAGRHSGTSDAPFVLKSDGAVIDGRREIPVAEWKYDGDGVYRYRPPKITRQILYVDGKPAKRVESPAAAPRPKLQPLEWCWYRSEIYFRPAADKVPSSYDLTHTHLQVGVTIYEVQHVLISGFVIQGFELDGVNAHDSVFGGELLNVVCRGNARSGVSVGGASRVTLNGCLIGNNGEAQLRTEGYSTTTIRGSDIIGNTAPRIVRDGGKVVEPEAAKDARVGQIRDLFRR